MRARCGTAARCFGGAAQALGLVAFVAGGASAGEQIVLTETGPVRVVTVAVGLDHPWALAFLPSGRMLISERPGRLRIVDGTGRLYAPLRGVPKAYSSGNAGFLDVALDPDHPTNRRVYLAYAEGDDSGAGLALGRGTLDEAGLRDFRVIFRQTPKSRSSVQFGARIVFARGGHLFLTLGDLGERHRAQDFAALRGQVVRIAADGAVPKDNPFVGMPGYRPETWSVGHRNAQGAALHPHTGELWVHEHGPRGGDELNIVRAGRNYGWPIITYGRDYSGAAIGIGTHKDGLEQPIRQWTPAIAPSGMAFYTGDKFARWHGNLLIGGLASRVLVRLELDGERVTREERMLRELGKRIRDVRQGPDGYVYLLTDESDGRILRLEPAR